MADITLSPDLRTKLDGIVQQMQTNGESDDYIHGVVNDFKQKYQYGSALPPPGRVSSNTVNTEGPSNIPGNLAIGLGMPATAAALAPLATAGTFGEAGSLAWPLVRSVMGEEAARRTAQHFGAPGWVQGLAGAGGSLLGGVGTSRIGKLLGINSPAEESFALATKYGQNGSPIADAIANRARLRSLPTPEFTPTPGQTPGFVPPASSTVSIGIPPVGPTAAETRAAAKAGFRSVPIERFRGRGLPPPEFTPAGQVGSSPQIFPEVNANGLPLTLPSGRSVGPIPAVPTPSAEPVPRPLMGRVQVNPTPSMPDWGGVPSTLPSGRSVGPVPAVSVPRSQRAPVWQGITDININPRPSMPDVNPIPASAAPSGRTPNSIYRSGPIPPVSNRTPFRSGTTPPEGETVPSAGSTLKPLETPMSKMEINRAIHARVQEWDLPGSPAGQKAPGMLSKVAQSNYGTKNFWDLSPDQMTEVHDWMDKNRTWPVNGELKPR